MPRPPFRIEELHIRSFRSIDELHLSFPADERQPGALAVLAGDNGCGKTAVLEALLLLLGKQDLLPEDSAPLNEQVQFGAADFRIEATVRVANEPPVKLAVDSQTLLRPLSLTAPLSLALDALKPSVEYFSARREPEALGETTDPRTRGARSVREPFRVLELKKRLVNTYYRALQSGKGGTLPESSPFARLQTFVRRFLGDEGLLDVLPVSNDPGADFEVILRKGEIPADITSLAMARAAAVSRRDIPPIVPIDRLSSGQVALFAFAGPLIFRDTPADIVLIDEPEQHMHLQWQGQLIRALRELTPESQIIVATHSLDIADAALSYERLLLLRDGDPRLHRVANDAAAEE